MHIAIRLMPATRATLLVLVPIVLVAPGGEEALSQTGTVTVTQAPLFTAIDLTPSGFDSHALGTSGGEQVGYGSGPATGVQIHALLWRGSAASVVDLNPNGFDKSEAWGICGGQQVGYGSGPATKGRTHALLWSGSAASVVDLHPRGFIWSVASGFSGEQQVGTGELPTPGPYRNEHALLWRGSAASVVDLHPRGFIFSSAGGVFGGQQVGIGALAVAGGVGDYHALLWRSSAASVVDLTPTGFRSSGAVATNGEEQVGTRDGHAMLWHGSAASVMDLSAFLPPGFQFSGAASIDANGDIVGFASPTGGPGETFHAFLWRRNMPRPGTSREQNTARC